MKSIVEEASSIVKAIEKGWASAGHPKEFTVKIYEEPQKNFIGMTVRPAKIGIFFTEAPAPKAAEQPKKKKIEDRPKPQPAEQQPRAPRGRQQRPQEPLRESRVAPQERPETGTADEQKPQGPIWTDEMIATAQDWIREILDDMGFGHIPFTAHAQHFHLKIQFSQPLLEDKSRQKHLFASLSNLLLTMLKRHYKRPLKGYKVVLQGE